MINLLSFLKCQSHRVKHHHHQQKQAREEILDRALAHQIKLLEDFSQKMEERQSKLLDEGIRASIAQIRHHIQSRFDEYFTKTQEEIDKYKQDREASIDENALKLMREVVKKALPEVIPSEDHTQIVLEALDQAKKEGFNL